MRINAIGKDRADITLDKDELVFLGNLIYFYEKKGDDGNSDASRALFYEMKQQVLIARDLCQYGHLDSASLNSILKANIKEGPEKRIAKVLMAIGLADSDEAAEDLLRRIKGDDGADG